MNLNTEQKVHKRDIQALIEESSKHKKWEKVYLVAKIIVTPLIITLVSVGVTWRINIQQGENTQKITEKQIESAQIIAKANREQSAKTSESSQRIERLKQIKDIFKSLLKVHDESLELAAQKMQIISMEVYKEDALVFLLNLKEHYKGRTEAVYDELIVQVDESISNILRNSQVNVSKRIFMTCLDTSNPKYSCDSFLNDLTQFRQEFMGGDNPGEAMASQDKNQSYTYFINQYKKMALDEMNLRQQRYENYNFSNCSFLSVNLYRADFSDCTLEKNIFMDVDLQETSFSGSNLSGSIFRDSNLQKTNFLGSRLRDVVFMNPILNRRNASEEVEDFCKKNHCCEMEGAQFTLGSLLWTKTPPFNVFDIEKRIGIADDVADKVVVELKKERQNLYINLLMNHHESITLKGKSGEERDEEDIKDLLKNTGSDRLPRLIQLLKKAKERAEILEKAASSTKNTSDTTL